jgi:hypothetical protein
MKPYHYLLVGVLGMSVIGLMQRRELIRLREQTFAPHQEVRSSFKSVHGSGRDVLPRRTRLVESPNAGEARIPEIRALITDMIAQMRNGPVPHRYSDELTLLIADLGLETVRRLEQEILEDEDQPLQYRVRVAVMVAEIRATLDPVNAMREAEEQSDPEMRVSGLRRAFGAWSASDPAAALAWYREQLKSGDPVFEGMDFKRMALFAQVRANPAEAIPMALAQLEMTKVEDSPIGSWINTLLTKTSDRIEILGALREAEKRQEHGEALKVLRRNYVSNLIASLRSAIYEDAKLIVETCFDPEEKQQFIQTISRMDESEERDKWMTWLTQVDAPVDARHPAVSKMSDWALADRSAAEAWLTDAPAGHLKDQAVSAYALVVAEVDLDNAAKWVSSLPANESRAQLVERIASHTRLRHPEATARFEAKYGSAGN